MKLKEASLLKIPLFLPPILFLALILALTATNCRADTDIVYTYDTSAGKDYNSLATWETDTDENLTSSSTKVFTLSNLTAVADFPHGTPVENGDATHTGTTVGVPSQGNQIMITTTNLSSERVYKVDDHTKYFDVGAGDQVGIVYLDCYDGEHNDFVEIADATADSNHYRCIRSAADCTTPFAGRRGTGAWFHPVFNTNEADNVIDLNEPYARVERIGAKLNCDHNSPLSTIRLWTNGTNTKAIGCVVYNGLNANGDNKVDGFAAWGDNQLFVNCISHNNEQYGFLLAPDSGENTYAYNCVAVDNGGNGFNKPSFSTGNSYVWNCVGDSNTGGDFGTGFDGSSDYNMSKDGTAPGTNPDINKDFTNMWVSETDGSENYHLSATGGGDTDFKEGENPSGTLDPPDYAVTEDIDGDPRSDWSTWYRGADEWTRNVDDDTVCEGLGPCYGTIGDALTAASAGDTIKVFGGTYPEQNITMKNAVNMVSNRDDVPIIQGTGSTSPGDAAVKFDGSFPDGCILDGFDISISGTDSCPGIYLHGTGAGITNTTSIKNCLIHGNTAQGIKLDGDGVTTTAPIIDNNDIYGNTEEGILIVDAGSAEDATIINNTIYDNTSAAGINIGGDSYVTIGPNNNIYGNQAGIVFFVAEHPDRSGTASSQPVMIKESEIHTNNRAGIAVIDNVSGTITIDDNKIYQNTQAGVAILNESTAVITDNEVYDHTVAAGIFTGDWSGTFPPNPDNPPSPPSSVVTFNRSNGPANLTIKRNKLYGNRAGMRLDHASGTISNNLVYNNSWGGTRYSGNSAGADPFTVGGAWGITQIENNTVVNNGSYTEVIVDNTDPGATFTGTWTTSSLESGYYGTNYHYHEAGEGSDSFRWAPTISTPGTYEIFARWTSAADHHASDATYTVYHDGATTPVSQDQGLNGGEWVSLGIYSIDGENNDDYVELAQSPDGIVIADAMMFALRRGGGIAYDAIYVTIDPITELPRNFYDRPVGTTQDPITIKNNILANNERAGVKYCADNSLDHRSHNLFYRNFKESCATGGFVDCARMCRWRTLGTCNAPGVNCCTEDTWMDAGVSFPGDWATGEICGEDPRFNDPANGDYTLDDVGPPVSPAINAGDCDGFPCDMGAYGGTDPITW